MFDGNFFWKNFKMKQKDGMDEVERRIVAAQEREGVRAL